MTYASPLARLLVATETALRDRWLNTSVAPSVPYLQGAFVTPTEFAPKVQCPYAFITAEQAEDQNGAWSAQLLVVLYFRQITSREDFLAQTDLVWRCMDFLQGKLDREELASGVIGGSVMQAASGPIFRPKPGAPGESIHAGNYSTIQMQPQWLED